MTLRLDRLRAKLDAAGADAMLVGSRANVRYLTGFSGSSSALYVGRGAAILFTDSRYTLQAREEVHGAAVETVTGPPLKAALSAAGHLERIGFEADHVSVTLFGVLGSGAAGRPLVKTSGIVEGLRTVKEPDEIRRIQDSIRLNSQAFEDGVEAMREGVAETRVAAAIENAMRERGAEGPAFESIVASGPRGAWPHARASSRTLRSGEPVVVDIGAILDGYASDMTRTVFLGEPDALGIRAYAAVLQAVKRAEGLVRAGVSAAEVDAAARETIVEAGFAEGAYRHGTGHGVGLEVHEAPHVGRGTDGVVLAAGMTVTIEPGVYLPGWGGIRIEDVVVVEEDGCRVLTATPSSILTV